MAATVVTTTTSKAARTKSGLTSRILQGCKSGLSVGSGRPPSPSGCFPVYVSPGRERFVVRAECANHPLFRRLLDDAEREYGYAAQGPIALPDCGVAAFLDVLCQMERAGADGEVAVASTPICGMNSGSKGRAAGYRMLLSPVNGWWKEVRANRKKRLATNTSHMRVDANHG